MARVYNQWALIALSRFTLHKGRLAHIRVCRAQRWQLLSSIGGAKLLEIANCGQRSLLPIANGAIICFCRFLDSDPHVIQMFDERTQSVVEIATGVGDFLGVFGHLVLLPAVANGHQERDQRGR